MFVLGCCIAAFKDIEQLAIDVVPQASWLGKVDLGRTTSAAGESDGSSRYRRRGFFRDIGFRVRLAGGAVSLSSIA